ncbi:hypothetical protein GA0070563_103420 [Micromonospora carbonacea]|uniref:Uncharacterized protein n=1 Tax=Micromonospora carbonacea TaxID=47853 RepID=A0A1C4WJF4_9ACTN|nr:hypothetical protein GA0070563_103420 [Micromonospora carbonacea]
MAGRQRSTGGPGRAAVGDGARRSARAADDSGPQVSAGRRVAAGDSGRPAVADGGRPAAAGNGARAAARSRSGAETRP